MESDWNRPLFFSMLAGAVVVAAVVVFIVMRAGRPCADVDRVLTEESLDLSRQYLLTNQKSDGSFVYAYDWVRRRELKGDKPVRQAEGAWALALLFAARQDARTAAALEKALAIFAGLSKEVQGQRLIVYPGERVGSLGTIAFLALRNGGHTTYFLDAARWG